ncbi:MAG: nucleotidyl transferase AbiEii/AbiGii toxin family protein [Gemmatimonadaceae bacterium]|nr:nucleotidyl transferase AbiEii/AbiGii toxin family protein [Chitinophagaceae bacterium]
MPARYLHELKEFPELLKILAAEQKIDAGLVEKDYWIMHVLYGLKKQNLSFEMKGGTSLSKGYKIIHRFSEDIDIQINPPKKLGVVTDPSNTKKDAVESRKNYYDWLKDNIKIDGIVSIERDTEFDNGKTYNSGGIRLHYENFTDKIEGLKVGILLEVGFDTVTPNQPLTISSWAYERAMATTGLDINDNRAIDISCYHPGYTFVEKLQTVVTKFRREQETGQEKQNLMRQYYDIYSLLDNPLVQEFIGTDAYEKHKKERFVGKDKGVIIAENPAFSFSGELRDRFKIRYEATKALYYNGQPPFDEVLFRIQEHIDRL